MFNDICISIHKLLTNKDNATAPNINNNATFVMYICDVVFFLCHTLLEIST